MHERPCPICGASTRSRLYAASNFNVSRLDCYAYASRKLPEYMHHRLLLCDACDLVYASPVPKADELSRSYACAEFDSRELAILAARTYAARIKSIVPELPDRCGALDIGTGEGAFLQELLALGFHNICGIEPSAAPIAAANPAIRPLIRQACFEPGMLPPESLSLITCFQTIEHVLDPAALCHEAFRILKPGGMLCIVGHNRHAWSARILGQRSPIFDLEHMQLFSSSSVTTLLSRPGFSRVHAGALWNRYPLRYWTRLFPLPSRIKAGVTAAIESIRVGGLCLSLPAGNFIAFGTRP